MGAPSASPDLRGEPSLSAPREHAGELPAEREPRAESTNRCEVYEGTHVKHGLQRAVRGCTGSLTHNCSRADKCAAPLYLLQLHLYTDYHHTHHAYGF